MIAVRVIVLGQADYPTSRYRTSTAEYVPPERKTHLSGSRTSVRPRLRYGEGVANKVTHERDLRSLDRPGLWRAFEPPDADERLPRELVLEHGIAVRDVGKRIVALLWPLALLTGLAILAWVVGLRSS